MIHNNTFKCIKYFIWTTATEDYFARLSVGFIHAPGSSPKRGFYTVRTMSR